MAEDIYRIISFPAFVNLITTKDEVFVHPLKWEDTHEGLYYTLLNDKEKRENLLLKLYKKYDNDTIATLTNIIKVLICPCYTYAQCWSTLSESDALWRIYDSEKASVQLHSTVDSLRKCFKPKGNNKISIKNMRYDLTGSNDEMFKHLEKIILKSRKILDPFFHKRSAFEHEREKRIIINDNEDASKRLLEIREKICDTIISDYLKARQTQTDDPFEREAIVANTSINDILSVLNEKLFPNGETGIEYDIKAPKLVPIENLSSYIKSVKLSPFAPEWVDKLTKELCEQSGLTYEGRSELYKNP